MRHLQLFRHYLRHPASVPAKCLHLALRATPGWAVPRQSRFAWEMRWAAAANDDFPLHHRSRPPASRWVSGEGLRACCPHVLDGRQRRRPAAVAAGDAFFVPAEFIGAFRRHMLPGLAAPFVLVTSNTDLETPGNDAALLDDPRLITWFAINVTVRHRRLQPLPIGLWDRQDTFAALETVLALPPPPRDIWLGSALNVEHHPERGRALAAVAALPELHAVSGLARRPYFELLRRSRFVLSPRGLGRDCYRTWEAMLCGAVPIVLSSRLDPLYAGLPVWIVADWDEITSKALRAKDATLRQQQWDLAPLHLETWRRRIAATRTAAETPLSLSPASR